MKITVSAVMSELEWTILRSSVKFVLESTDARKIHDQWPIKEPIMLTIETKDAPPKASITPHPKPKCKTDGWWCCRHGECGGVDCCVHGSQSLPQNTSASRWAK